MGAPEDTTVRYAPPRTGKNRAPGPNPLDDRPRSVTLCAPMPTIHVGTAGFPRPRARYAQRLSFVELEMRQPMPSPKVAANWRSEVGDAFTFALVAPASLWGARDWPLKDPAVTRTEIEKLAAVARKLRTRAIVLRPPPAVRPGSTALKRFLEAAEQIRKLAEVCVWEPPGVWERDSAKAATEKAGLVVAADPLRDSVEGEAVVYARMRGLGSDRRYHEGRLQDLAEALSNAQEAFVVFDTATGFTEASKLRVMIEEGIHEAHDDEDGEDEDEDEDEDGEDGDEDEE
jgi:uncharacterized protein YecE (DUF72 family)